MDNENDDEEIRTALRSELDALPVPPVTPALRMTLREKAGGPPAQRRVPQMVVGIVGTLVIAALAVGIGEAMRDARDSRGAVGQALASASSAASPTSVGSRRVGTLGQQLGAIRLGDSQDQVVAALGQPTRRTITHGIGSPQWEYDAGYIVHFTGSNNTVWQIQARPPTMAATGEGFVIGDADAKFQAVYARYRPRQFTVLGLTQFQVNTSTEVLISEFDATHHCDLLVLRTEPGPP